MKNLLVLFWTILILMAAGSLSAQQSANNALVKLVGEQKYEISNVSDTCTLRIPIVLEDGVKGIKASKSAVSFGNRYDQALFDAFTVEAINIESGKNNAPAIIITVSTNNLEQGTYKLSILIESNNPNEAAKKQSLNLDLTLPVAQIQAPGTLTIGQTVNLVNNAEVVGKPSLTLLTTNARRVVLRDFTVEQVSLTRDDNYPTTAKVRLIPRRIPNRARGAR